MEIVEASQVKGDEQKKLVEKIVRQVVVIAHISDEKEKLLQQIKSGELDNVATPDASPADESPSGEKTELSEWEKRLEGIS